MYFPAVRSSICFKFNFDLKIIKTTTATITIASTLKKA